MLLVSLLSMYGLRFIFLVILVEFEILFNTEVRQCEVTRIDRGIRALIRTLITVIINQLSPALIILFKLYFIGSI